MGFYSATVKKLYYICCSQAHKKVIIQTVNIYKLFYLILWLGKFTSLCVCVFIWFSFDVCCILFFGIKKYLPFAKLVSHQIPIQHQRKINANLHDSNWFEIRIYSLNNKKYLLMLGWTFNLIFFSTLWL